MAAPTPLEEQEQPVPITPEQRPQQERVKMLDQEQQEWAALQVSLGHHLQVFVQREIDMQMADEHGYP